MNPRRPRDRPPYRSELPRPFHPCRKASSPSAPARPSPGMPDPLNPGARSGIAPGWVAIPSISSATIPASAIARSAASIVRSSADRKSRRPTCDRPTPEMMVRCSPGSLRGAAALGVARVKGEDAASSLGEAAAGSGSNTGSATSSLTASKRTFTPIPIRTDSIGQLTTRAVNRRLRCSSSSIRPSTKGLPAPTPRLDG